MFTALLLDHVASTVVTGFNLSVLRGVNTVYVEGGLASQLMTRRRGEGRAWCTSSYPAGECAGGRIRLSPKDVSGDGARVCPPSTPHQHPRVDVITYAEHPLSLPLHRLCSIVLDIGRVGGAVRFQPPKIASSEGTGTAIHE